MTVGNHLLIENITLYVEIGHFAKRGKYLGMESLYS